MELSQADVDNPIMAMVSLSMMLDPSSVQTIIEKMEVVRDSLTSSVEEENALEEQAIRENDYTLNEIFNAMQALIREKGSDDEALQETIQSRDME